MDIDLSTDIFVFPISWRWTMVGVIKILFSGRLEALIWSTKLYNNPFKGRLSKHLSFLCQALSLNVHCAVTFGFVSQQNSFFFVSS